jgi:regulator of sigma E protease
MELIPQLLIFLLVLGIVVAVHELGHYGAGRLFGAAADSFSIGFGKPLAEVTDGRGTRWRINRWPLGGFVKFVEEPQAPGDGPGEEVRPDIVGKRYGELKPQEKIVVALAGPFANFVLASLLFAVIFATLGKPVETVRVAGAGEGTPAAAAGFEPGDVIRSVEGKTVRNTNDVVIPVALNTGTEIEIEVERNGQLLVLPVTPERAEAENNLGQKVQIGRIGVQMALERLPNEEFGLIESLPEGVAETGRTLSMSAHMLGRLVTGKEPISNLKGPVGIADTTRRAIDVNMKFQQASLTERIIGSFWTLLQLTALISVGIGLVNLLPLPILDGGHVVFHTYELLSGREVPQKVQDMSLTFGLIMLFGVAAIVTFYDVIGTGVLGGLGVE